MHSDGTLTVVRSSGTIMHAERAVSERVRLCTGTEEIISNNMLRKYVMLYPKLRDLQ
jgi:hypothetical protein